ncbi:MAG: YbjQ family protein [Muribaculaceae bacterium]
MNNIQLFTTHIIEGMPIEKYFGIVTANQVAGTGFFTDLTASFSDFFGGNSGAYRESMNGLFREVAERLKEKAIELGANAIIGVSIDYDNISAKNMSMFMVSIQGTAVRIADNSVKIQGSKGNDVSWDELNLAYHIRKINRKLVSNETISVEEWKFLLKHPVESLTPSLYQYYLKCIDALKVEKSNAVGMYVNQQQPNWATTGKSNFKKYLSTLDYKDAIKYVYKNVVAFKEIITNNKLFSASNILNIAKEGNLDIAISLLSVEKLSYNSEDLSEMQELAKYLKNLPDVSKIEEIKGGLFSSRGMKFICSCGTKNEIPSEYCSNCLKNIKGLTAQQQQLINNYIELVETLTEIMS